LLTVCRSTTYCPASASAKLAQSILLIKCINITTAATQPRIICCLRWLLSKSVTC
jgi:hypothetical protein